MPGAGQIVIQRSGRYPERMVTVQLRDAKNIERFLIDHIVLPFEPRVGVPLYVWDRFEDPTKTSFLGFGRSKQKPRCFIPTKIWRYEVSLDEPSQSGIVYLAEEVKPE
jgi:hypothetical protein